MLRRIRSVTIPGLLALATTLAGPGAAAAHALLVASDPAAGASLASAPAAVTLTFSEEPDPRLSQIKVLDSSGAAVSSGEAAVVPGETTQLRVPLETLESGVYTVAWRTVSAVDGHLATGSFAFAVGTALPSGRARVLNPSQSAAGGSASLSITAVLGRWLLYVGLIGLLGASLVALFVIGGPVRRLAAVLSIAWLAAAGGTALVIGSQVADAGVSLGQAFASSLGVALTLRVAPVLVGGLAVLAIWRTSRPRAPILWVTSLAAGAAMLADSLTSHAAAGTGVAGTGAPLNIAVQWLHIAATGVWLGGLVMLLISLRGRPSEGTRRAAGRFATIAAFGIAVVAGTGLLRALGELTSPDQLVTTSFGLLLVAKTVLLAGLAALGALNHFRNVPMAGRSLTGLRRTGSVEIALGATVLVLSASLVNLAPPAGAAAAHGHGGGMNELVASGHDFGTSVRLRLEVSPGEIGSNEFRASVTDFDTGAPASATALTLRFTLPSRPDVGASQLKLKPSGNGVFTASGTNLSLEGTWQVAALVQLGSGAVEVNLELTTHGAPATPRVDVNAAPGQPTIYTVRFAGGQTVQVYLDPGKAGPNEVHVTYFDASGNEAPVPSTALSLRRSGSPALTLKPRALEPGHFVADATLAGGTYTLAFSGTPPGGHPLSAQLDVKVVP